MGFIKTDKHECVPKAESWRDQQEILPDTLLLPTDSVTDRQGHSILCVLQTRLRWKRGGWKVPERRDNEQNRTLLGEEGGRC